MNKNSLLCRFINKYTNWRDILTQKNIAFKEDSNGLCIFKYRLNAPFSEMLVREARGIIIDLNTLEVVCWPFTKFFNQHEMYADEIDWENCRVQEKLDGSICKLFWNKYRNEWQWATNGVLDAKNANVEDFKHVNYLDLIEDAWNYKDIDFDNLNKDYTYIFEVVDPIMHPVKYDDVALWHIGTRNNITGIELNENIGIQKPKEYDLHSLEEVIKFVESMNQDEVTQEGVVVVDKDWKRIKVKNLTYLQLHYLDNGIITSKEKILKLLNSDDIDINFLIQKFPQYREIFDYYMRAEIELEREVQTYINYVRQTYINIGSDRKRTAEHIRDDKYRYFGFKALDSKQSAKMMLTDIRLKNMSAYANMIKEYSEDN